jgi:hypothetical protein
MSFKVFAHNNYTLDDSSRNEPGNHSRPCDIPAAPMFTWPQHTWILVLLGFYVLGNSSCQSALQHPVLLSRLLIPVLPEDLIGSLLLYHSPSLFISHSLYNSSKAVGCSSGCHWKPFFVFSLDSCQTLDSSTWDWSCFLLVSRLVPEDRAQVPLFPKSGRRRAK